MTDNEIIEALEMCNTNSCDDEKCSYAECNDTIKYCQLELHNDILNLIKRQQEDIELLKIDNGLMTTKAFEMAMNKAVADKVRAEAIKEFADKLENRFFNYYEVLNRDSNKRDYRGETLMVYEVADMIEDCIDGTLKEMVGAE